MHIPPRSLLKNFGTPPRLSVKKTVPSPQGAWSFSWQQGRITRKWHPGSLVQKGHFAMFCFCICVCKKGIPLPPRHLCKIFIPLPLGNLVRNGHPPAKVPPSPLQEIPPTFWARGDDQCHHPPTFLYRKLIELRNLKLEVFLYDIEQILLCFSVISEIARKTKNFL